MRVPEYRPGFLPTINCSKCGIPVDITLMGEHICSLSSADTKSSLSILPTHHLRIESNISMLGSDTSVLRSQRPRLPPIDPYAGNRPGFYSGETTPASSGQSSLLSPRSLSSGQPSPRHLPLRKVSSPLTRQPPSPELKNIDCAFPPFPPLSSSRSKTARNSKASNSDTEYSRSRTYRDSSNQSTIGSPRSSKLVGSTGTNKRAVSANSAKYRNGFGRRETSISQSSSSSNSRRPSFSSVSASRKGSVGNVPPLPSFAPPGSLAKLDNIQEAPVLTQSEVEPPNSSYTPEETPESATTPLATAGPLSTSADHILEAHSESLPALAEPRLSSILPLRDRDSETQPERAAKSTHKEPSYRAKKPSPIESGWNLPFLRKSMKTLLSSKRQHTFPLPDRNIDASILATNNAMASNPDPVLSQQNGLQQDFERVLPSEELTQSPEELSAQTYFAQRSSSIYSTNDHLIATTSEMDVSQEPDSPFTYNFIQNYATSIYDAVNSPPSTSGSDKNNEPRSPLHISTDSAISAHSYASDALSIDSRSSISSMPAETELTKQTSRVDGDVCNAKPSIDTRPPLVLPRIASLQPDSPTDPLFQHGRLSPIPASSGRRTLSGSKLKPVQTSSQPGARHEKMPSANRGTCRGCSAPILPGQKSVTSADGRLSGRYHKKCLVCQTCQNGFATADFYVLNDSPYCSQHYHELDGSLCSGCGQGIEGRYVEIATTVDTVPKMYHPQCLTCATCRVLLRDGYFEFSSRIYCEADAFRLASLPSRSQYDSAPLRSSPLVRELVSPTGSGSGI